MMAFATGQAQPQQSPWATGTPYNPQQGQPFGAWSPQPMARPGSSPPPPPPGGPWPGPSQQPQGGGQPQGPSFAHPFAQHAPAFQFRATDFMGNQFDNPAAFTAQQGATAQALNNQRTQQIHNMFTNGTPLGGLNPMAAYQQGQQMLQGGQQNPFGMSQGGQQAGPAQQQGPFQDLFQTHNFTPPSGFPAERARLTQQATGIHNQIRMPTGRS